MTQDGGQPPKGIDTLVKVEVLVQQSQQLTNELKALFKELGGNEENGPERRGPQKSR